MSGKSTEQLKNVDKKAAKGASGALEVTVISFGYKEGPPPEANVVFDVRFLKNPYWVDELRPMTGLDKPVQKYVLEQELAQEFIDSIMIMLTRFLPRMAELEVGKIVIAFGCTGGQHRSATMVEAVTKELREKFPTYVINACHREIEAEAEGGGE